MGLGVLRDWLRDRSGASVRNDTLAVGELQYIRLSRLLSRDADAAV